MSPSGKKKAAMIAGGLFLAVFLASADFTIAVHQPTWQDVVPVQPQLQPHYLPWDNNTTAGASHGTVAIHMSADPGTQPYNFNGTSWGRLNYYLPANVNIWLTFTNNMNITHSDHLFRTPASWNGQERIPQVADPGAAGWTQIGPAIGSLLPTTAEYNNGTGLISNTSGYNSHSGTVFIPGTNLTSGLYVFICGVPGHGEDGMYAYVHVSNTVQSPYYVVVNSGLSSGQLGGR